MRLDYHIELLHKALSNMTLPSTISIVDIEKGLKYPDIPCGKYAFDKSHAHVNMVQKKLCESGASKFLTSYIKSWLTGDKAGYDEFDQSHNGFGALNHATTGRNDRSVQQVADRVVDRLLVYMYLAIFDSVNGNTVRPNGFWLGAALHVLMDGYSPAHVVRLHGLPLCTHDPEKLLDKMNRTIPTPSPVKTTERKTRDFVRHVILDAIYKHKVFKSPKELLVHIAKRAKAQKMQIETSLTIHDVYEFYMFMYFYTDARNHLKKEIARSDVAATATTTANAKATNYYQVIDFQNYSKQDPLYHLWFDSKAEVEKYGLHSVIIQETQYICRSFFDLIASGQSHKAIGAYLKELEAHLRNYTFSVHPLFANRISGNTRMENFLKLWYRLVFKHKSKRATKIATF